MVVCRPVVDIIEMVLRFVVEIVTTIVRTVCGWVSSVITVLKEVCEWVSEKVCSWLPWPINKLCEWTTKLVCKVIEVTETVWKWVCKEIFERIISILTYFVTYLIYILRWLCIIVDILIFRWWKILLCLAGISRERVLRVCPCILVDTSGVAVASIDDVNRWLDRAAEILAEQCGIRLVAKDFRIIRASDHMDAGGCGFTDIFSDAFNFFSANASNGCLTLYFVRSINGACGCSFPGATWALISVPADGCAEDCIGHTIVHEFGHLALLTHRDDAEQNIMFPSGCRGDNVTSWQCCMMRTSSYVTAIGLP